MTTVGQHPGYELGQPASAKKAPDLRVLLAILAIAIVAGLGYLALQAVSDTSETIALDSPSVVLVQDSIDTALVQLRAQPSSVDIVQAQIDGALMGVAAGPSSVDIVQAQIDEALAMHMVGQAFAAEEVSQYLDLAYTASPAHLGVPRLIDSWETKVEGYGLD